MASTSLMAWRVHLLRSYQTIARTEVYFPLIFSR
ncbi:hypothetical protein Patl1_07036 [Pistacia atlantica]|uniref:Uncharacterized protein n=1 Tax=Pistacia atlantica TaxID=434234 RepID=A0ACC1AGX5_9ROSI|nr:hypothetical protein Patl1_07036 [Pistacia atlantica]